MDSRSKSFKSHTITEAKIDDILVDPVFKLIAPRLKQLQILEKQTPNLLTRRLSLAGVLSKGTINSSFNSTAAQKEEFAKKLVTMIHTFKITHIDLSHSDFGATKPDEKSFLLTLIEAGLFQIPSLQKINLSNNCLSSMSVNELQIISTNFVNSKLNEINLSKNRLGVLVRFLPTLANDNDEIILIKSPKTLVQITSLFVAKYKNTYADQAESIDDKIKTLPEPCQEAIQNEFENIKKKTPALKFR